jgi:DNA replication regulator SLD2
VPDTQAGLDKDAEDGEDQFGMLSESDSGSEGEKKAKKKKKDGHKKASEEADKKEGTIRKVAKKVSAMAHQNFKRLKLRNRGAKGGPGQGSRFRRRR